MRRIWVYTTAGGGILVAASAMLAVFFAGEETTPPGAALEARTGAAEGAAGPRVLGAAASAEADISPTIDASAADPAARLLKRFDAIERRLAQLERRVDGSPPANPNRVGQVIAGKQGTRTAGRPAAGALEARLVAIERRLGRLGRGGRSLRRVQKQVSRLRGRLGRAEKGVKVSRLTINQQVALALESPLGRELIKKINELEEKVDNLLSKRVVQPTAYTDLVPGLWATYYKDRYFTERAATQIDAQLDYDWKSGAPKPLNGQKDNFSVRWEGVLRIPNPGNYTFYTLSDDGVRVWIGEQLVLAEYTDHAAREDLVDLTMEAGDYPIRVEYYERGGRAVVQLLWKHGGAAEREAVPAANLFHTVAQERR